MSDDARQTAIVWAALEKIAGKEERRELLLPVAAHNIDLTVSGSIDGKIIDRRRIAGVLSVGHDTTRASRTAAKTERVVAYLLAKFNPRIREKILRTLPEEFAEAENTMPAVDAAVLDSAKNMLSRLRAKKSSIAKGSVSFNYTVRAEE